MDTSVDILSCLCWWNHNSVAPMLIPVLSFLDHYIWRLRYIWSLQPLRRSSRSKVRARELLGYVVLPIWRLKEGLVLCIFTLENKEILVALSNLSGCEIAHWDSEMYASLSFSFISKDSILMASPQFYSINTYSRKLIAIMLETWSDGLETNKGHFLCIPESYCMMLLGDISKPGRS